MNKIIAPLNIKVISRMETLYKGTASSVSASDDSGSFDILPGHENFMALLKGGSISVDTDKDVENIKISHGIIHVTDNIVEIFVDI